MFFYVCNFFNYIEELFSIAQGAREVLNEYGIEAEVVV